ncbi:ABC transporter substrate-binding protein [Aromatoleum petrolei]|uniref:ABC transporter substrate-binding protein n=1 Tax=Aromatoleum petrolei TaxID=76116 RepID=A0ABX1MUM7_9RHOO|nr:ABC transporter substrate-binding protein [Aromatoleum petrolei]NMF90045.1 ABC transporter substrate-binding protein [Aromatoleum petrolei]QTQ36146.1 Putative amino acid/amide ABC transporter, substrate-binding protein [Aromatoleum petrolei]
MKSKAIALVAALAAFGTGTLSAPAAAQQANEQFFPLLVYRTGAYAPNGTPWANGKQDYVKYVNATGGINGVKIAWEECETGYATDKGVECYERLKSKKSTVIDPQATGITFALTDKAPVDKIPLITLGYGLAASQDGGVFKWNFPLMGSYWTAADALIQHLGKKEGGLDKLKGKKIALVYHDSPFGKEPIPLLQKRAQMHGFELVLLPVTAPGVEQKATWLQVRQQRPDYTLLWGWGVMNSTALKEAVATGYPREKLFGVWWSGAEPDVKDVGANAKGYSALALNPHGTDSPLIKDILKKVHDGGQGSGPRDEVGSVLYMRGLIIQMLAVEAVRTAQEKFGKGKVMTGEQVRWGLENLNVDEKRIAELGLPGLIRPIKTTCTDHMGSTAVRVHSWDGTTWKMQPDWYEADKSVIDPLVKEAADKYAADKQLKRRDASDCNA